MKKKGNNFKVWDVTAELNMCAENIRTIEVKAKSERKAKIIAEEVFKQQGCFFVDIRCVKEQGAA